MAENPNVPNPLNPDGGQSRWQVVWDVHQRKWYYVEQETQKVSWDPPAGCSLPLPKNPPVGAEEELGALPDGWRAYYDSKSQKMCFQNLATGVTQWQRPQMELLIPNGNGNGNADTIETKTASPNTDDLPQGWRKVRDPASNRDYYVSPDNVTQWHHPSQNSPQKTQDSPQKTQADSKTADSKTASDWEPRWDADNRRWCFINAKAEKHQYKKPDDFTRELPEPPELPAGWSAAWDNTQNKFYFLSPEKKPQWDAPPVLAKAQVGLDVNKVEDAETPNTKAPASTDQGQDELPPGWSKAFDKNYKKFYYFNRETNVTQWHPPEPLAINESAVKDNVNKMPKQVENSTGKAEKQVENIGDNSDGDNKKKSTEKAIDLTKTVKDRESETQENKEDPKKRILNRAQLKMLAKLVLKDDSKRPEYDFDGVLDTFWKTQPGETTTLEEFLANINQ